MVCRVDPEMRDPARAADGQQTSPRRARDLSTEDEPPRGTQRAQQVGQLVEPRDDGRRLADRDAGQDLRPWLVDPLRAEPIGGR
jgi:hypothetical protein